jgi:hypothetical protein
MLQHYILRGKEPVEVTKAEWVTWRETADRQVARTDIQPGLWVSTLFTGIALKHDPSTLFETMICGPERGAPAGRYATYAEAILGHHEAVRNARLAVQRKQ